MTTKKILCIDDDEAILALYRAIFKNYENIEMLEATDGMKGFTLARDRTPDLIIIDNKMPNLPGEQTAKLFRGLPATRHLPIIMVTAMKLSPVEARLIKLDVNEIITKPFKHEELIKTVEEYLGPIT